MGAASLSRTPNPDEPVPRVALPALCLLAGGIALWTASTVLYLGGTLAWWATIPINAACSYALFTVAHDASHHSLASAKATNDWLGRLATPFIAPFVGFRGWRFIHMQHHRFTNHHDGSDPDDYTNRGPGWQAPLRWLTIDCWYVVFYVPRFAGRPRAERLEVLATLGFVAAAMVIVIATGNLVALLVVYLIPVRAAIFFLGFAFDYLPHHGLSRTPQEDRFKTTRLRVGKERLLSPVLLYQNYHLVHHLHPIVPFHRYVAVWLRGEQGYLEHGPELCTPVGRPLTPEEYRRLREPSGP